MREYKFRAWDSLAEKMYSWTELLNKNLKNIFTIPEQCGYDLMQYTGLKDKNGKEIYEGDIIKCSFYPDFIFEIKFTELCWYMRKIPTSEHIKLSDVLYEDLEVIGNIYDNKNLLEEGE